MFSDPVFWIALYAVVAAAACIWMLRKLMGRPSLGAGSRPDDEHERGGRQGARS